MNALPVNNRVFGSPQKSCTVPYRVRLTIGERVAVLRSRKGLTQAQLAQAAGLKDRTHLSRIESGDIAKPEADTLFRLAEVLETTPEFLRFGDDGQDDIRQLGDVLDFSSGLTEIRGRIREFGQMLVEIVDRTEQVGKLPFSDTPMQMAGTVSRINDAPMASQERFVFPIEREKFIEKEYDYPQPLHTWIVPMKEAVAGKKGGGMFPLATAEILHSIRDAHNGLMQVIRIIGNSMSEVLRDGYKVLVDTTKNRPENGDCVVVYIKDEGGMIGYWNKQGDEYSLTKENAEYDRVPLGEPGKWLLWGTVTTIVEAPLRRMK
jgi:transcriptional regulator with XRE-family HTH domain